jgi:hypothetical protein
MNVKIVDINNKYIVKITYHDNSNTRYYRLIDIKTEKTICESFNRDSFLLKANKIVKLSNNIECLIASY